MDMHDFLLFYFGLSDEEKRKRNKAGLETFQLQRTPSPQNMKMSAKFIQDNRRILKRKMIIPQ